MREKNQELPKKDESGLTEEELQEETTAELPDREAMSVLQPDIFMPWPAPLPPDEIA